MVTVFVLALWLGAVKAKPDPVAFALEPVRWAARGL